MKRILTYGTFDLFHYGHLELLRQARGLGDYLLVGLSSDEFNREKGKESYCNFEKRREMLSGIRYVDFIFPEINWGQKPDDIKKYDVNCLVMGADWTGKFDFLGECCQVVYFPRTPEISTTKIKSNLPPQRKQIGLGKSQNSR